MWHTAAWVGSGWYALNLSANLYAALSFTSFGCTACLIEAQFLLYRKPQQARLFMKLVLYTLGFVALQFCLSFVSFLIFGAINETVAYILGNLGPGALYVIGFFPQIWEFIATRDVSGYSFGVTFFDCAGCLFNGVILYSDGDFLAASKEAAPFIAIVFMHIVLVLTAIAVLACPKRSTESCPAKLEGDLEDNETKSSGSSVSAV